MKGARGLLVSITGGADLTLYEVDEAAGRIRQEVDDEANIIVGATFDRALGEAVRVSVVATGVDPAAGVESGQTPAPARAEPVFHSTLAPPAPEGTALTVTGTIQAHLPRAAATEVWTQPLLAPVIPFPEPSERRRALLQETNAAPPAVRRRSLLERLGVAVSEKHASGWR